jgi:CDP-glycerol glycerophosphotransferase (TagB/SpsB family)
MLQRLAKRIGLGRAIIVARLIQFPARFVLGFVERVIPQSAGLVVFGCQRDQFADNAAYAYLAACRMKSPITPIWITGARVVERRLRSDGLPVAMRWSFRGIAAAVRAECFVVSAYRADVNAYLGARATLVNLWHGIPFKRIQRDIGAGPLEVLYRPRGRRSVVARALAPDTDPPDYLLSPSAYVAERCFTSAFRIDLSRCWNLGYPRADHLHHRTAVLPSTALVHDPAAWSRLADQRVVGFFPTWRDGGESVLQMAGFDIAELAFRVRKAGGVLLYKPHCNEVARPSPCDGLVVLRSDEDLHAYLGLCEVLITDYSSVALDFILTGRPILYFTPDLDSYRRSRGFYFAPESVMSGPILRTPEELHDAIDQWACGEIAADGASELRNRFWEGYRFDASTALLQRIVAMLDLPDVDREEISLADVTV